MEVKQKISCACSRQEQVQEKHRNEWGMGQGLLPVNRNAWHKTFF